MGLGKTISTIALITTLYTTKWEMERLNRNTGEGGPFLIVCPATVINQWVSEIKVWTSTLDQEIDVQTFQGEGTNNKQKVIK